MTKNRTPTVLAGAVVSLIAAGYAWQWGTRKEQETPETDFMKSFNRSTDFSRASARARATAATQRPAPKPSLKDKTDIKVHAYQNREGIDEILSKLAIRYSIKISYHTEPNTSWKIDCKLADKSDYSHLHNYVQLLNEEFQKYPKGFIHRTRLSSIALVKRLSINGQLRAAVPDYGKEILILDFRRGDYSEAYQRHVMHHEFYHMIEEEFSKDPYWKDPNWARLNSPEFQYGSGGINAQSNSNMYLLTHPEAGFINLYSMSALEEDKAEIYASLFADSEYDQLLKWAKNDKILSSKIKDMKSFLYTIDNTINDKYWLR